MAARKTHAASRSETTIRSDGRCDPQKSPMTDMMETRDIAIRNRRVIQTLKDEKCTQHLQKTLELANSLDAKIGGVRVAEFANCEDGRAETVRFSISLLHIARRINDQILSGTYDLDETGNRDTIQSSIDNMARAVNELKAESLENLRSVRMNDEVAKLFYKKIPDDRLPKPIIRS